jgi:hypothetical protein
MKVTLNQIREKKPCEDGWQKLLKSLDKTTADDTEVSIAYIAKSNSVNDAMWVLFNVLDGYQKEKAYLMHDIAAMVLPIYEKEYPNDTRVRDCLQAIKDFADGKIANKELDAAWAAAWAAAAAAWAAADAAAAAWAAQIELINKYFGE